MTTRIAHRRRLTRLIAAVPATVALTLGVSAAPVTAAGGTVPRPVPPFDDGGFEEPSVPVGFVVRYGAGSDIGQWRITGGDTDLIGPGYWQAAAGGQSLDLDGDVPGSIEQTFATTVGVCYAVHFALAGNVDSGPAVKTGYAQVSQSILGLKSRPTRRDFAFDITGKSRDDMGYVRRTFYFRSLSSTATLGFTSTTGSGYGPVLDDVSVTADRLSRCRRPARGIPAETPVHPG
ncbi:choice-of-anchor C family protein [Actinomadura alba]|uniref:Choice-of-anchor C family protein n=1 Tax=Actinomadura alba TaxID=406431 RepID=A0ABR7M3S5_9ACTN|nr:choice-of-anchor C family protein [Actinomadura alba]MBC6471238.1 choice-of-anchor C family protein [Actinomadura alba]